MVLVKVINLFVPLNSNTVERYLTWSSTMLRDRGMPTKLIWHGGTMRVH